MFSKCGEEFNVGPVVIKCDRPEWHRNFLHIIHHSGNYMGGWKAKWNYNVTRP